MRIRTPQLTESFCRLSRSQQTQNDTQQAYQPGETRGLVCKCACTRRPVDTNTYSRCINPSRPQRHANTDHLKRGWLGFASLSRVSPAKRRSVEMDCEYRFKGCFQTVSHLQMLRHAPAERCTEEPPLAAAALALLQSIDERFIH